jgi:hypothetical protein
MQVAMMVLGVLAGLVAILLMDRGLDNLLEQAGLTLIEWARARRARVAAAAERVAIRAQRVYPPRGPAAAAAASAAAAVVTCPNCEQDELMSDVRFSQIMREALPGEAS